MGQVPGVGVVRIVHGLPGGSLGEVNGVRAILGKLMTQTRIRAGLGPHHLEANIPQGTQMTRAPRSRGSLQDSMAPTMLELAAGETVVGNHMRLEILVQQALLVLAGGLLRLRRNPKVGLVSAWLFLRFLLTSLEKSWAVARDLTFGRLMLGAR